MTKFSIIIAFLLFSINSSYSQKQKFGTGAVFKVWIDTGKTFGPVYLAAISDSVMYPSIKPIVLPSDTIHISSYTSTNYRLIRKVRLVKKGTSGRGFLIGSLTGAAVGVLAGFAHSDSQDNTCFFCRTIDNVIISGVSLAAVGGVSGALIGLKEKKFLINYQKSRFDEMRRKLQMFISK